MTTSERMLFRMLINHIGDRKRRMEEIQFSDIPADAQRAIAKELGQLLEYVEAVRQDFLD